MSDEVSLRHSTRGFSSNAIRLMAMIAIAIGTFGSTVLERGMLTIGHVTSAELMEIMNTENGMGIATAALVCRMLYCCAVPLYAFLTLEGFLQTSDLKKYVLRTAGLAVVSEIPYNLAVSGKLIDLSSRNPVFGIPLALLLLYLYDYCGQMGWKGKLLDVIVTIAALVWVTMLSIAEGTCLLIIVITMYLFRKRPGLRGMAGAAAALFCCGYSVYYALSPFSMLAVYAYNEEEGNGNQLVAYLFYPVCLIICAIFVTAL